MNKVSLNGVEIYPFDSEQSLLSFVNDNKGILVAINAEKFYMLQIRHEELSIGT